MRTDIDRLMEDARLDALLVLGSARHNPAMAYFAGRAHLTDAILIKRRGRDPVLIAGSMEREEAAGSGLRTRTLDEHPFPSLLREAGNDTAQALAFRLARFLTDEGVAGRVSLYGQVSIGVQYSVLQRVSGLLPGVEWVGEMATRSVLGAARSTKDLSEVARIRRVAELTVSVVAEVADFLTGHAVRGSRLVRSDGEPLTIGDVRRRIGLLLAERGVESPEGTIFSQGRDAGIPHSVGNDAQAVEVGRTIIFDIFPCEAGGGYFYDFTRTWCLGGAPAEVERVYADVRDGFETVRSSLRLGAAGRDYQLRMCEFFRQRGHPTVADDPATRNGYVHGLGHGVGLAVHEGPSLSHLESNTDRIEPGAVFSFEPGLYYPEKGFGVRLEDTLWARPDGGIETLAEFALDLVLPLSRRPARRAARRK